MSEHTPDLLDREIGQPTPGEWFVCQVNHDKHSATIGARRDNYFGRAVVAVVHSESILRDELEANALLIAAAPALLEACKAIILDHDFAAAFGYSDYWDQITAAIAKAEGRDPGTLDHNERKPTL